MNKETIDNFANNLSFETGIDTESATKVVTWLVNNGVLDTPVVTEDYNGATE